MNALRAFAVALICVVLSPEVSGAGPLVGEPPVEEGFRAFLRQFFTDPQFQLQRVRFPLEWRELVDNKDPRGEPFLGRDSRKTRGEWKHLAGPEYFRCKTSCYDLVTYDNFQRRSKASTERVVAFEGVDNGINIALYFRLIDGKWMLVRFIDEST